MTTGARATWPFPRILHRQYPQQKHGGDLCAGGCEIPSPVRRAGIGELGRVQPVHVIAYIERLQGERLAPTVKQCLFCIRMLFDWLVTGQLVRSGQDGRRTRKDLL
jgi:hypothetical protein